MSCISSAPSSLKALLLPPRHGEDREDLSLRLIGAPTFRLLAPRGVAMLWVWAIFCSMTAPIASGQHAPAQGHSRQPGRSTIHIDQTSPLSQPDTINARFGVQAQVFELDHKVQGEAFELFLPQQADSRSPARAGASPPPGAIVWVSPSAGGHPPQAWLRVLKQKNLIWIGANNSGNAQPLTRRISLALDAADFVIRKHEVDPERLYVAGMSGGGRVASRIAPHFPDVFAGGLYVCGCDFFAPIEAEPGKFYAPYAKPPSANLLDHAKRDSRLVLITGSDDFNRKQTRLIYRQGYQAQGFDHVHLIDVAGMGHVIPSPEVFAQAVDKLDAPLQQQVQQQLANAKKAHHQGAWLHARAWLDELLKRSVSAKLHQQIVKLSHLTDQKLDEAYVRISELIEQGHLPKAQQAITRMLGPRSAPEFQNTRPRWHDLHSRLTSDPRWKRIKQQAARAQRDSRREAKARAELAEALSKLRADDYQGWLALDRVARVYRTTEAGKEAGEQIEKLRRDADRWAAIQQAHAEHEAGQQLKVARALLQMGKTKRAKTSLRQIIGRWPDTQAAGEAQSLLDQH